MAKKHSYQKRVRFEKGEQKRFIEDVIKTSGMSIEGLAQLASVHPRSLRDWRREKLTMPLSAVEIFCRKIHREKPRNIEILDSFWYGRKGSILGWLSVIEKYGRIPRNEEYRKKKWYEWWENKGKNSHPFFVSKPVKKPEYSIKLAEFVGISMGDGGITKRQIMITMNSKDDSEYGQYVEALMKELFGTKVSRCYYKNAKAFKLYASGSELVKFCNEKLGLPIGDKLKQGLDIPAWIKNNPEYEKACLKGLVDTDGCLFYDTHKINGRSYSYPKLNFTSYSPKLIKSVNNIMEKLGMNPRVRRSGKAIQIENREKIEKYFAWIGTNNPKHLKRWGARVV